MMMMKCRRLFTVFFLVLLMLPQAADAQLLSIVGDLLAVLLDSLFCESLGLFCQDGGDDDDNCPNDAPMSGDDCSFQGTCNYDKVECCDGSSGYTKLAQCNDGTVIIALADIDCGSQGPCDDSGCPIEAPEPQETCSWNGNNCKYNEITCCNGNSAFTTFANCEGGTTIVTEALIDCGAGGQCDDQGCPIQKPTPQETCTWEGVTCRYKTINCCDGREGFDRANCVDGAVQVTESLRNCGPQGQCDDQGCPFEEPAVGAGCTWTGSNCQYDPYVCCDGSSGFITTANCSNEGFTQIAEASINCGAEGQCDENDCPIGTPSNGAVCSYEGTCRYDKVFCCNGFSDYTTLADCNGGTISISQQFVACNAQGFCSTGCTNDNNSCPP